MAWVWTSANSAHCNCEAIFTLDILPQNYNRDKQVSTTLFGIYFSSQFSVEGEVKVKSEGNSLEELF